MKIISASEEQVDKTFELSEQKWKILLQVKRKKISSNE